MRAAFGGSQRFCGDVVDGFLPFFHAGFVVGKAHAGVVAAGAGKAQQFGNALLVGAVFAQAFFQHGAKFGVEPGVRAGGVFACFALCLVGCCCIGFSGAGLLLDQVFQHAQYAAGVAVANGFDVAAFLQQLAAHVQGQVAGINHAFDKTQVLRQQGFCLVHDEHAAHIEFEAVRVVALVQVKRRFGRQIQQLRVFGIAFYLVVAPGQRVGVVVRQLLVKVFVLLGRDVFFRARPQGAGFIDLLPLAGWHHFAGLVVFAFFPFFFGHENGQADVVGILVNQLFELVAVEVVELVFAQVQGNAGAARGLRDGLGRKIAHAATDPAHAFFGGKAGATAFNGDFVSHDEAGIKAHAKLADELRIGFLVARELAHKIFGAAFGNGAQVGNGLLCAHANAVVFNGDGFGCFVRRHAHAQVRVAFVQFGLVQRLEAQFVAGVRRVADQLAHENIGVGVQGMGDQMQQLRHFGLKGMGLCSHENPETER